MSKREIRKKRRMFTRQFYHRNRMPLALGVVQTILLVGVNLLFRGCCKCWWISPQAATTPWSWVSWCGSA